MSPNSDAPVLADATAEDSELVAEIAAMYEHDAVLDPATVARMRREVLAATALAVLLAAPNTATPDVDEDWFIDESVCASTWLDAIADHAYSLPPAPADDDLPLYGFRGGAR